jgi:hypothetical protein
LKNPVSFALIASSHYYEGAVQKVPWRRATFLLISDHACLDEDCAFPVARRRSEFVLNTMWNSNVVLCTGAGRNKGKMRLIGVAVLALD